MCYVRVSVTEHEIQVYELAFKVAIDLYLTTGSFSYFSHNANPFV